MAQRMKKVVAMYSICNCGCRRARKSLQQLRESESERGKVVILQQAATPAAAATVAVAVPADPPYMIV